MKRYGITAIEVIVLVIVFGFVAMVWFMGDNENKKRNTIVNDYQISELAKGQVLEVVKATEKYLVFKDDRQTILLDRKVSATKPARLVNDPVKVTADREILVRSILIGNESVLVGDRIKIITTDRVERYGAAAHVYAIKIIAK